MNRCDALHNKPGVHGLERWNRACRDLCFSFRRLLGAFSLRATLSSLLSPVSCILSPVSCILSPVSCILYTVSYLLLAGILLLPTPAHCAESAASLVNRGNELYRAGDYDQALAAYEQALTERPDVGEVLFNKGNALFQKGDYVNAREAYQAAALHTKDLALEASAHYNLGSAVFADGQKQLETDPRKTLTQWGQSIQHFQEALRIDPQLKDAAQNIEVVRLALKDLADRIKKAEEAAREQRTQREELKKELEEVIREQEAEIQRNDALRQQAGQGSGESLNKAAQELASDQEGTRRKTGKIADKLKDLQAQSPNPSQQRDPLASTVEEHLEKARDAQQSAVAKLEKTEFGEARSDQDEALQHLKQALADPDAPENKQGQCPNPKAGDQNEAAEAGDKETEKTSPQDQSIKDAGKESRPAQEPSAEEKAQAAAKERGGKEEEPKAGLAFSESPENILREEKEHRLQLQRAQQGAYKPVDKDW